MDNHFLSHNLITYYLPIETLHIAFCLKLICFELVICSFYALWPQENCQTNEFHWVSQFTVFSKDSAQLLCSSVTTYLRKHNKWLDFFCALVFVFECSLWNIIHLLSKQYIVLNRYLGDEQVFGGLHERSEFLTFSLLIFCHSTFCKEKRRSYK